VSNSTAEFLPLYDSRTVVIAAVDCEEFPSLEAFFASRVLSFQARWWK
jgi:hypothetical protein